MQGGHQCPPYKYNGRVTQRPSQPNMLTTFITTLPFFALIGLGFIATRRGQIPLVAIGGMNRYVLYFALPCLLFKFGSSLPVAQLFDVRLLAIYTAAAAVIVALCIAIARRYQHHWLDSAMGALVTAFPNTGFLGVPLLVALLGASAAAPVMATILVDMVLTSTVCVVLAQLDTAKHGIRPVLLQSGKALLANPMPWAIGLGAVFAWQSWQLAAPVAKTVGLLADSASPVALFTMGAVLARAAAQSTPKAKGSSGQAASSAAAQEASDAARRKVIDLQTRQSLMPSDFNVSTHSHPSTRADWLEATLLSAIKLLLHPLLVWLGVWALGAMWPASALDAAQATALILAAALPSASNVFLLAERFGARTERIAHIILISTVLSVLTFSLWAHAVQKALT